MKHKGDLSAAECWDVLKNDPAAALIDVRTRAEWMFVGIPDIAEHRQQLFLIEWQIFPDMAINTNFADQLSSQLNSVGRSLDSPLCFLCKTGGRSLAAAEIMAANGYTNTYNLVHGFEGDKDGEGHRGNINGWKAEGMPWHQQ